MIHVRERPPLRLTVDGIAPSGRRFRWADDDPDPANVPGGLRFSSTMPGGHESLDLILPRDPAVDYADLVRLSTLRVLSAGGDVRSEARLERTPRASGDRMAVTPSAVGWQAHLADDKSVVIVYVDRDAGRWGTPPLERQKTIAEGGYAQGKISPSSSDGLVWDLPPELLPTGLHAELMYQAPAGAPIASVGYRGARTGYGTGSIEAPTLYASDTETLATPESVALTLDDTVRAASLTAARRYLVLRVYVATAVTPADGWQQRYSKIAAYGDHDLTTHPVDGEPDGLLASDIIRHAVTRWAPLLQITDESVQPSGFVIPHSAFLTPTTAGEIVRQTTRFGLQDWAVWEDRTFWWHPRGHNSRTWRARVAQAGLEETGPQVDRLWESVIVSYQDVDGTTRTVGPPSSGADTETSVLKDPDPENPANQLGAPRRDLLTMGTSTAAGATEVGRRFLEEQKQLDSSGRATIVGHVHDDRGVLHPYHAVRAGDQIEFVDASDTSPRRVVRADHTERTRSCTIDLDAPPEGLQALLERLGVVLAPLGP